MQHYVVIDGCVVHVRMLDMSHYGRMFSSDKPAGPYGGTRITSVKHTK